MRLPLPTFFALTAMLVPPASGQVAAPPASPVSEKSPADLAKRLKPEDLDRLFPLSTRQILHSTYGTFLLVSSDYGSGLELREAHIYVLRPPVWELIAYRRTNSAALTGKLAGDQLVIVQKSGKVAMSIPLDTANLKFDTSEH